MINRSAEWKAVSADYDRLHDVHLREVHRDSKRSHLPGVKNEIAKKGSSSLVVGGSGVLLGATEQQQRSE